MSPDEQSPFDPEPGVEMVWLNHSGGKPAQFPVAAVPAWRAMGWVPCAAPPDVDPALVERPDLLHAVADTDGLVGFEAPDTNSDEPEE